MNMHHKHFASSYYLPAPCRAINTATPQPHQLPTMARYCAHQSVDIQINTACLANDNAIARRPAAMQELRYYRTPAGTSTGLASAKALTRSKCYWTTEANVSESKAENTGTWWLTVSTGFASLRSAGRTTASKYDKALVATVALPETITNTGLRSCLCRTTA